jgi:hypothetical protein
VSEPSGLLEKRKKTLRLFNIILLNVKAKVKVNFVYTPYNLLGNEYIVPRILNLGTI